MATALTSLTLTQEFVFAQPNGSVVAPATLTKTKTIASEFSQGVGAAQVNTLHYKQYTIAGGATETIDLNAASFKDLNNEDITFARLKVINIELPTGVNQASSITVDGAAANVICNFTADILPGNAASVSRNDATGWALTNGTADKIVIVNNDGSNSATVNVLLAGGAT